MGESIPTKSLFFISIEGEILIAASLKYRENKDGVVKHVSRPWRLFPAVADDRHTEMSEAHSTILEVDWPLYRVRTYANWVGKGHSR